MVNCKICSLYEGYRWIKGGNSSYFVCWLCWESFRVCARKNGCGTGDANEVNEEVFIGWLAARVKWLCSKKRYKQLTRKRKAEQALERLRRTRPKRCCAKIPECKGLGCRFGWRRCSLIARPGHFFCDLHIRNNWPKKIKERYYTVDDWKQVVKDREYILLVGKEARKSWVKFKGQR